MPMITCNGSLALGSIANSSATSAHSGVVLITSLSNCQSIPRPYLTGFSAV